MAQSVLSRPKVRESHSREPFDRSFVTNVNQSAGMLRPVFCEPCVKGTKGVINRRVFTRASEVVAPAFPDVKQCFDFFKVPLRLLISSWLDYDLNINDIHSSALVPFSDSGVPNLNLPASLPYFNFGSVGNDSFLFRLYNGINNESSVTESMNRSQATTFLQDAQRVFEGLGYGQFNLNTVGNDMRNLLPLAAYQAVYYHHYRNTSYENNNPYAYNLDWLFKGGQASELTLDNPVNFRHMMDLCRMRYVNYRNDYWHNIYPSLNLSQSSPNGSNWVLPSSVVGASVGGTVSSQPYLKRSTQADQVSPSIISGQFSTTSGTSNIFVSVQQIRAAFALDKLMRASAYTPKHIKEQIMARYGVEIADDKVHSVERIGSFENNVVFGEVTNVAGTDSDPLGRVGGKGIGSSDFDRDITFYTDEDCLIIGICYFIPRAIYDKTPDPWTKYLVREDFPQPEFQNLGLRPLINPQGGILGYTVPDLRYKIGIDCNQGEFMDVFNNIYYDVQNNNMMVTQVQGNLASYTLHTRNLGSSLNGVNSEFFKVVPEHLDPIFKLGYDGSELRDQFFYNVRFKFATTAPLSVHGQPSL